MVEKISRCPLRFLVAVYIITVFVLGFVSGKSFLVFSGPPASGDWVVTGTESHSDEVIVLNGNLIVDSGGNLTFRKVTLKMNCTYNGQYNITVMGDGKFYLLEDSVITSADPEKRIGFFFVRGDSTFRMNNGELHDCGSLDPELMASGLRIVDSSDVIIENSLFSRNMFGIIILSDGVVVRNNNITANDDKGIQVHGASPVICDNHVSLNRIGIGTDEGSPNICNNTITLNNENGISAHGGSPTIYNNTIRLNKDAGISISNCNPAIQGNNITSNLGQGIRFQNESNPIIQGNIITLNMHAGIHGASSCSPVIQGNNITSNSGQGIMAKHHCTGIIQGNIITSNIDVGIYCHNHSLPEIHWNDIYGNEGLGVENNDPSVTVNATYNYWGDGPSTSSHVIYDPWLTESIFCAEITSPLSGEIVSLAVTVTTRVDAQNGAQKVEFYMDDQIVHIDYDAPYEWNWNTTEYAETEHKIMAKAYDIFGLKISTSITVFVDNTPPLVVINAPANGTYVKDVVRVDVTCTDDNFNRMELYINGILKQTWTESGMQTYDWNTSAYTDGSYTLKLMVYDEADHWKTAETTVIVDNTSPTAEISKPTENTLIKGSCEVTVYGYDVYLDVIELYINESLITSWEVAGTYAYTWNITDDGAYKIMLLVKDKAGTNGSDTVTVIVDNTPPTISIKEPSSDDTCYGTISVSVNATDNNEIDNIHVNLGDTEWSVMTLNSTDLLWKYYFNTTTFSDGQYTLMALALDKAGNPATTSTTILIDNAPPTLTIQSPQSGMTVGLTLTVDVQASDASGISRIEFYLQDLLVHTATHKPYEWSWDTTEHPNGEYTITVKAYDMIGRTQTSETTITVQNVESPWWQTHFWTIIEVLVAIGGLTLATLTYLTRKKQEKKREKKKKK